MSWTQLKPEYDPSTLPPEGVPVLLYSKDWIDDDFVPRGIVEGYYNPDLGFVGAFWNPCHDTWDAVQDCLPTHWMDQPDNPDELENAILSNLEHGHWC